MQSFDESQIRKVQLVSLKMAEYFVRFCDENHLLCFFCGGGCIGAVRHHGFIPWDDDLDFFLPREDYEKLKSIWNDTEQYTLRYPTQEDNDHNIFITLRDKTTTMVKEYQKDLDIPHGIAIDVFPLDGCPKKKTKRISQLFWALLFQLYGAQMVPTHHGIIVKCAGRILLGIVKSNALRYKIWKYAERKMSQYPIANSKYITELCAGPHYMRIQYPKEIFSSALRVDFEKTKMPIPVGYDQYLKLAFGNYMDMPPAELRVPSHEAFIEPEKPYSFYKGIEYCVNKDM